MLLAEASNEFAGQFWYMIAAGVGIIVGLIAVASYFATSREVDKMSKALDDLASQIIALNAANESRASDIHDRLNPLQVEVGELRGSTESFEKSFEKFTRVIEASSRANNETISAFTRSLDTFASVVERSVRERHAK